MNFFKPMALASAIFASCTSFAQLSPSSPLEIGNSTVGWTNNGWKKSLKVGVAHAIQFPGTNHQFGIGATTAGLLFCATPTDLTDQPASYRMSITQYGNVGIGTVAPAAQLDVQGTFRLGVGGSVGGEAYCIGFTRSHSAQLFASGANGLLLGGDATGYDMAVLPNGNVGIGTGAPTQKLSVNGTVLAKKVKVSTTAADWPDYVFRPDYQLPTLTAVEQFISRNGHLPDIPSAETVATEGQDLGEMNKQLLRKVEELTLYLIEMEKKQQAMEATIRTLQDRAGSAR